jgi:hypothetical protein
MILPSLKPWLAGDQVDEDLFGRAQNAIDFLMTPPEAIVGATAAQTNMTNTTYVKVTFNLVKKDSEAAYDATKPLWSASQPDRLTIRTPGYYEIHYGVWWDAGASGTDASNRQVALKFNGQSEPEGRYDEVARGSNSLLVSAEYEWFFNVNDYIELYGWQDSGGTRSLLSAAAAGQEYASFLRVKWVSL